MGTQGTRRHPRPAPCLRRDTHALLPAPPPHPRLRRSSPAPGGGGVRARAYIWWAAVSGVKLVDSRIRFFSRLSPCTGPWEYRPWGKRPAGRGNLFPLSCLPHSNHLTSRRLHLAGISAGNSRPSCREGQRPGVYPVSVRARPFAGYLRAAGHGRYHRRGGRTGPLLLRGSPFSPGARILP